MSLNTLKLVAQDTSRRSYSKYQQHGAVLVRNGKVISTGVNNERGHAEVNAILRLRRLLPGVSEEQRKVAKVFE